MDIWIPPILRSITRPPGLQRAVLLSSHSTDWQLTVQVPVLLWREWFAVITSVEWNGDWRQESFGASAFALELECGKQSIFYDFCIDALSSLVRLRWWWNTSGTLKWTGIGAVYIEEQQKQSEEEGKSKKPTCECCVWKLRNEKWQAINFKWLIVNNTLIPRQRNNTLFRSHRGCGWFTIAIEGGRIFQEKNNYFIEFDIFRWSLIIIIIIQLNLCGYHPDRNVAIKWWVA